MKKKVIIPIVVSAVTLLFGSLIYCGISAFPELLEAEHVEDEPVIVDVKDEDDIVFDEPIAPSESLDDFVVLDDMPASHVSYSDNIPNNEEIVYIEPVATLTIGEVEEVKEAEPVIVEESPVEIAEEIVDFEPIKEKHISSGSSYISEIDYRVTFVCDHCSVYVCQRERFSYVVEELSVAETINSNIDFEIVCEEGYQVTENNIQISGIQGEDWNDIANEELFNHISDIKADLIVTVTANEILPIEDEDEEQPKVVSIEKAQLMTVSENNNPYHEIIDCTLIVIAAIDVLALLIVKRNRKKMYHI